MSDRERVGKIQNNLKKNGGEWVGKLLEMQRRCTGLQTNIQESNTAKFTDGNNTKKYYMCDQCDFLNAFKCFF